MRCVRINSISSSNRRARFDGLPRINLVSGIAHRSLVFRRILAAGLVSLIDGFFAYASRPPEIGQTILAALEILRTQHGQSGKLQVAPPSRE
jgi:hypothetical protein